MNKKLEDYTEAEFLELLEKIFTVDASSEDEHDTLVEHFEKITEHPYGNGLIYYPDPGVEDSPQGVLGVVKAWRVANGKSLFKPV
jgi:hypothetical protein